MKNLFTLTTLLILSTAAQVNAQIGGQTPGPRDLFNTYGKNDNTSAAASAAGTASTTSMTNGRPGARLRIELDRGGRVRWVSTRTTFQAGDRVRFHFAMNFPGYVAIINQGSSGKRSLLFPYEGVTNRIGRTADYTVPQGEAWFEFDDAAGQEQLTFIMSKREIQEVSQLIAPAAAPQSSTAPAPAATSNNNGNSAANPTPNSVAVSDNTASSNATAANAQPPAAPAQTEEQEILAALNSRALAGGRDLRVVEDKDEDYVLASEESLAKPVGFKLTLKHR